MMSRTKWYFRPNRAYAMGICLHHRRPILYDEGRAKGCVSRRRCKWFRPVRVRPSPEIPETSTHPAKASARAVSLIRFSFSRKNSTDISMIQMGDVYRRIAAVESGMIVIAEK